MPYIIDAVKSYVSLGEIVEMLKNEQLSFGHGKVLAVIKDEKFESVPSWFIDFLPMNMAEMKSEITNSKRQY
jgi:hypothetical protein